MKRKGFAFLAAVIASQLLLSGAATVSVSAESDGIGEAYTAPESPAPDFVKNHRKPPPPFWMILTELIKAY